MTEPGLGSGALREALSSRLLQWRKIHASTKGQWRTNYEEGRDNMLLDCIEGLAADVQNFAAALSLSSPIGPAYTLDDKLRALHEDNVDISQMLVMLAKDVHGLARPIPQASSEIREALDRLIDAGEDLRYDEYGVMEFPLGHLARKWDDAKDALVTLLAPSRQGAGGK